MSRNPASSSPRRFISPLILALPLGVVVLLGTATPARLLAAEVSATASAPDSVPKLTDDQRAKVDDILADQKKVYDSYLTAAKALDPMTKAETADLATLKAYKASLQECEKSMLALQQKIDSLLPVPPANPAPVFQVMGDVTDVSATAILLWGKSFPPNGGGFPLGSLLEEANIRVESPSMQVPVGGKYFQAEVFLRKDHGLNALGAEVPVWVFGPVPVPVIPADQQQYVGLLRKANDDVEAYLTNASGREQETDRCIQNQNATAKYKAEEAERDAVQDAAVRRLHEQQAAHTAEVLREGPANGGPGWHPDSPDAGKAAAPAPKVPTASKPQPSPAPAASVDDPLFK